MDFNFRFSLLKGLDEGVGANQLENALIFVVLYSFKGVNDTEGEFFISCHFQLNIILLILEF